MRLLWIGILSAGCHAPEVAITERAVLDAPADEVSLHDGSGTADAAMADQICVLDTRAGEVLGDHDLGNGTDRLLDVFGTRALAVGDGALFDVDGTTLEAVPAFGFDALAARHLDQGLVAMGRDANGCAVAWSDGAAWAVPSVNCTAGASFAADRATGAVWIADGQALTAITADGHSYAFSEVNADRVLWNPASETLVLARAGESLLRAVTPDGQVAWGLDADGAVVDLELAEATGTLVVSVSNLHGGEVLLLDANTGQQIASHPTPIAPRVSISRDGLSLALLTADAVHFYDVDPDAGLLASPTTAAVEDANGAAAGTVLGVPIAVAAVTSAIVD